MRALLLLALVASAAHAEGPPKLEPFLTMAHTSDILTGPPFLPAAPGCEASTDFVGAGATIVWPRVEVDLAQGIKWRDLWCGKPYAKKPESGTLIQVRWYPWRNR